MRTRKNTQTQLINYNNNNYYYIKMDMDEVGCVGMEWINP